MTKRADQLPDELVFEPDGHVGEVALSCLADGEISLVPPEAMAHLEGCEVCTARLGTVALRSLGVGEALRAEVVMAEVASVLRAIAVKVPASAATAQTATPTRSVTTASVSGEGTAARSAIGAPASVDVGAPSSRKRRPLPRSAIGAALLIAAVASVPTWLTTLADLRTLVPSVVRAVGMMTRVAAMLFRSTPAQLGGTATALRWMAAVILIGLGVVMAGSRSRRRSLQGGVG